MTAEAKEISSWNAKLITAVNRHSIVFVPLGAMFNTIRPACLECLPVVIPVEDYLQTSIIEQPDALTIGLSDVEQVCHDPSLKMGLLRNKIHEDFEKGRKFVLFSRYPRARYPEVPGSSILLDAKLYLPPLVPTSKTSVKRYSVPGIDNLTRTRLVDVLTEVGMDAVTNLDYLLYEAMIGRDELLNELDRLDHQSMESLRSAGLVYVDDDRYLWTYPQAHNFLRFAVADVIASYTIPPAAIAEAFRLVWGIERMIRFSMRSRAIEASVKPAWQTSALTKELSAEVLERATREVYAASKGLNEIRDPLEWLTLGELLSLRTSMADLYGDLGVSAPVWTAFAGEVPAIRNRLSHMRLLQKTDLSALRKWHTALSRKLARS